MKLTFYGAAGEVTGSCHVLEVGGRRILLDCGLIQGSRRDEARNRDPFPFQASDIDAVVLSHAHLDHCGRLPLLVRRGFRGPVYAQRASCELVAILLADAARLEERDAEYLSRKLGKQIKPLFTFEDGREVVEALKPRAYAESFDVVPGVTVTFRDAGHIIGSCVVEVRCTEGDDERILVFSGDLGQYGSPILRDPESPAHADVVIMESLYGDRLHRKRDDTIEEMGEIIQRAETGNILIPAFAIGRSQEVLYQLGKHFDAWGLDRFRIFLDSPMAIEATEVYWSFDRLYDEEAKQLRARHERKELLPNLHLTRRTEESMALNRLRSGAIIIAGSGMCNGGRIVHHLRHNLPHESTQVMILGYQARGSLGRRLVDGQETVRIFGQPVQVKARIHTLGGLSAHGDQEDLARWVEGIGGQPPVWLVHSEEEAQAAFTDFLDRRSGIRARAAQPGEVIDLRGS
ncbi:MAG: MBL fold metallo-hydrolase [Xanthomonadales bacterium]|nr:MBL fold metallo-hydrolase [Xanthomonadales bacterium]